MASEGVHRTHCCKMHRCKYGEEDCPVTSGKLLQDYLCEFCVDIEEAKLEIIDLQKEIAWVEEFNARSVQ